MSPQPCTQRAADRPVSTGPGLLSRHGLSFGTHYDPDRTSFGALVAHNDDVLDPGVSYGVHSHRDVEILAWVVDGALEHRGPDGDVVARPGTLQQLVAGTGWRHDEASVGEGPLHVVQMWVAPALDDPPPGEPFLRHLAAGEREPVALHRSGATFTVARLDAGERWVPTAAPWRHVHVARGSLAGGVRAGDTLEATGDDVVTLEAGPDGAEVLIVSTHT